MVLFQLDFRGTQANIASVAILAVEMMDILPKPANNDTISSPVVSLTVRVLTFSGILQDYGAL